MKNNFTTVDELSRESIINEINQNLFVEAGAGSGKTTMLVNRMIAMVEAGIPVEKICAITFTKNAALEFYERFQRKLIERSNNNYQYVDNGRAGQLKEPTEETRNRCKLALENIDLCFMGTIDSFCNMILSEHPSEANIPSDAKLISEEEKRELYKQFYIKVRNGFYGEQLKNKSDLFDILFWDSQEKFVSIIDEFMERRNLHICVDDTDMPSFYNAFENDRKSLKRVLDAFNSDTSKLAIELGKTDDRDPEEVYKNANEILQKGWIYNVPGVIRSLKDISKLTYKAGLKELGIEDELAVRESNGIITLNIADEESKDALLPRLREYKYNVSMSFVSACVDCLQEQMRKDGKFTYFDYLYYLRNMLKNDANDGGKLIDYIYNAHSYFLIDEFQDTNPLQAEVFFYLSAQDPNQKSWLECKPKPGSLFIVGDPKQSIYRFRGADVSSYLRIKEMFKDDIGKVLHLNNNFRSRNVLKSYFNDVFEEVMPEANSNQSKYEDIENTNSEEDIQLDGIYSYESYSGQLIKDYPEMEDSERLISIIKQLVNNSKYKIKDRNTNELRSIKFSDFMIIFAGKKNIASSAFKLLQNDIPVKVEGKVLFEENEALQVISDIYKTVIDNEDVISLVATLFGPVFGFNNNDLTKYRSLNKTIKLSNDIEYGDSDLEIALARLNKTANLAITLTPSALFETIMDEYQIFRYVSFNQLEIVYYVLELLRNGENNGEIGNFVEASAFIENLLLGDSEQERCLSLKENEDAVHIANLHKVKGLEAPIVILTKAGSASSSPSVRIEEASKNGEKDCYILSIKVDNPYLDMPVAEVETKRYSKQVEDETESLKKENDRLVYVAATRARNVLIVNNPKIYSSRTGKIQNTANRWKLLKEKASADIFEVIQENNDYQNIVHQEVDAKSLYEGNKTLSFNVEPTYQKLSPSSIASVSKYNEEEYVAEGRIDNDDETYSTLLGTMVHRLMQMIVVSKDKLQKEEMLNNILNEYVTSEFKNYEKTFNEKLNKVYDVMHNGGFIQKGNAPQDILSIILNAEQVYSEAPFTYKQDNIIYNGIIDLIYKKDGKLHIIDYKTNRNDDDLDNHYADQLKAYIKACETLLNEKIEDALIYHIDITNS